MDGGQGKSIGLSLILGFIKVIKVAGFAWVGV